MVIRFYQQSKDHWLSNHTTHKLVYIYIYSRMSLCGQTHNADRSHLRTKNLGSEFLPITYIQTLFHQADTSLFRLRTVNVAPNQNLTPIMRTPHCLVMSQARQNQSILTVSLISVYLFITHAPFANSGFLVKSSASTFN